jgi:hypothetical protein
VLWHKGFFESVLNDCPSCVMHATVAHGPGGELLVVHCQRGKGVLTTRTVTMPAGRVGILIGRQGERIKSIEADYGVYIVIPPPDDSATAGNSSGGKGGECRKKPLRCAHVHQFHTVRALRFVSVSLSFSFSHHFSHATHARAPHLVNTQARLWFRSWLAQTGQRTGQRSSSASCYSGREVIRLLEEPRASLQPCAPPLQAHFCPHNSRDVPTACPPRPSTESTA